MPSEGGEPRPISPEDRAQGIPTWSPDSRRLIFGDVPKVFGQPDDTEVLHEYDVTRKSFSVVPHSRGLWTARWSPDGRFLAAVTIAHRRSLRVFDFQRRLWQSLPARHVDNPTWTKDGRFIYYQTEGDTYTLRRIRVADGLVEPAVDLSRLSVAAPWWFGLAPDGSPMLLRNLGTTEIYAMRLERR